MKSNSLKRMSPRERLLTLRAIPGFNSLSVRELTPFARLLQECEFRPGEHLLREGDTVSEAYIIVSGRVGMERDGSVLDVRDGPSGVGLLEAVASGNVSPGDVIALEHTMGFSVETSNLLRLYETEFLYIRSLMEITALIALDAFNGFPFDPRDQPSVEEGPPREGEMDFVDRLLWMAETFWEDANLEAIAEIARNQEEVLVPEGEYLWEQGDESHSAVRIRHGMLEIDRSAGGKKLVGFLGYGDDAGFLECFAGQRRTYSALAKTDTWVVKSEVEELFAILEDNFDLAMTALSFFAADAVKFLWSPDYESPSSELVNLPFEETREKPTA